MIGTALTIYWQEQFTNKNVYGIPFYKLPIVSYKVKCRRMKIARHCLRHHEFMQVSIYSILIFLYYIIIIIFYYYYDISSIFDIFVKDILNIIYL